MMASSSALAMLFSLRSASFSSSPSFTSSSSSSSPSLTSSSSSSKLVPSVSDPSLSGPSSNSMSTSGVTTSAYFLAMSIPSWRMRISACPICSCTPSKRAVAYLFTSSPITDTSRRVYTQTDFQSSNAVFFITRSLPNILSAYSSIVCCSAFPLSFVLLCSAKMELALKRIFASLTFTLLCSTIFAYSLLAPSPFLITFSITAASNRERYAGLSFLPSSPNFSLSLSPPSRASH
mmetsp:Transcript_36222/g.94221  ORF Transcript_36222/g.94221 Transcript_36222/m.94221 type:complete len:234 (+) Transcript_36222:1484-2185(+)